MKRLLFVMVMFFGVLALALAGRYVQDPQTFLADPLERIYEAVRLFTIENDWPADVPMTFEWQLARFLAPLVTVAGLVLVFAQGAWVAIVNTRARFERNHVVLVGLNLLGWNFVRSCHEAGLRTVAIERDEANPYVDRARSIGVPVIVGDALTSQALLRAGVVRAAHLVTFVSDDGTNVELTLRAKSLHNEVARPRNRALRVHCHLSDVQLATRLEQYPKFFLDPHLVEIGFFNVDSLSARMLLQRHPLEIYADVLRRKDVHVAVLGTGSLAEQVVLQVARSAHYASFEAPRVSLCMQDVAACRARIERLYPRLHEAARLAFVEMPLAPDAFEVGDARIPVHDATAYVVCLEDESAGLSLALALRRATLLGRGLNAPVMVAMEHSTGLARLLESELGTPEIPDGLYPFGMLNEVVSAGTIVDERLDRLAQAFHETYLETVAARSAAPRKPSQVPWSGLAEMYRNANRQQADHVDVKLRAVGCREEPGKGEFQFEPHELERLARMDRNRFVAVRFSSGWKAGDVRSDFARIDDNLKPWDQLDAAGRSFDMDTARDLPGMLAKRLGHTVKREIVIGVTGHRLNRLSSQGNTFARAVDRTLDHIRGLYPDGAFSVMSSLAEGADRVIARAAMERLGARLYVPLPLPFEVYVEDFGTSAVLDRAASVAEFYELLGQAERYFELPLEFGSRVELAEATEAGALGRARQYALAGAYVTQRCHELIAVWDGQKHEGEGGTAQVVGWRLRGVPDVYRYPDRFFPAVEARAPFIVPPDVGAEFVPTRLSA